ncbi:THO complex subunit 2, partial [Gonapodya sp. JEL0774]
IIVYENLSFPLVESARYITDLTLDAFCYAMRETLQNTDRGRTTDGTHAAPWLQNLALFAAAVAKKYRMDLEPLLRHVFEQATDAGDPWDLVLLRELVEKMAGLRPPLNPPAAAQVEAMAGSEMLRREIFGYEKGVRRSGDRLKKGLKDCGMLVAIAIGMGQLRAQVVFGSEREAEDLKPLGGMFDQVQTTFTQYVEFLTLDFNPLKYSELPIPDIASLCGKYGLDPEIAFHLKRPQLVQAINDYDKLHPPSTQPPPKELAEATMTTELPATTTVTGAEGVVIPNGNVRSAHEMDVDSATARLQPIPVNETTPDPVQPWMLMAPFKDANYDVWHPALRETIVQAAGLLPAETWSKISPHLYVTFWQLSLYDLWIPSEQYGIVLKDHEDKIRTLSRTLSEASARKADSTTTRNLERDKQREQALAETISRDKRNQEANKAKVLHRLKREKDLWLPNYTSKRAAMEAYSLLLDRCILPRALLSHADAVFAAKFVILLHELDTANISFVWLMDAASIPIVLSKLVKVLVEGLESKDYIKCRNAIIVINALIPEFPPTRTHVTGEYKQAYLNVGPAVEQTIKWAENAEFEDLKLLSTACQVNLKKEFEKDRVTFLTSEDDYLGILLRSTLSGRAAPSSVPPPTKSDTTSTPSSKADDLKTA